MQKHIHFDVMRVAISTTHTDRRFPSSGKFAFGMQLHPRSGPVNPPRALQHKILIFSMGRLTVTPNHPSCQTIPFLHRKMYPIQRLNRRHTNKYYCFLFHLASGEKFTAPLTPSTHATDSYPFRFRPFEKRPPRKKITPPQKKVMMTRHGVRPPMTIIGAMAFKAQQKKAF